MVLKKDLKPGMWLQNIMSKRVAQVAGERGKLLRAHREFVQVYYRREKRWRKGTFVVIPWWLRNVRLAPAEIIPQKT